MKNENVKKYTIIGLISLLVIAVIGVAYAYFGLEVEGTGKDIVMDTGDLRLEYIDDQELSLVGATPGDSVSKTITVKNIGTRNVAYTLYWGDLINTIENFELHITMECKSYKNYGTDAQEESGTCDRIYRAVPMSDAVTSGTIKNNISIDVGITHEYNLTVSFDNKTYEQNYNKNKKFTGKIGIEEYKANDCVFDGELTSGVEYVNGVYTYRYKQQGTYKSGETLNWENINSNGWGVQLTNKVSTDVVTESPCTYVNNIPVISMSYLYGKSNASSIDLNNINTRNVTNMSGMFADTKVDSLDLSSFDTSNVTNMNSMFYDSNVSKLDISSFNTSNVTNMNSMFKGSKMTFLDLSSFDTSNVTGMGWMFAESNIKKINLNSFDTSKVTTMYQMFSGSKAKSLDVSSFDTSNVTSMQNLFANSAATEIKGLENFNTSKVTTMYQMFSGSKAKSLDVSNFDTSNVTDMSQMFSMSLVEKIIGLENFNTSKVISMNSMFSNIKVTSIDLSSFDTSKVTNMNYMFGDGELKSINGLEKFNTSNVVDMSWMFKGFKGNVLDLSSFDTKNVTNMNYMFYGSSNLKTIYASSSFVTDNVTSSDVMFYATAIVGGNGTKYDNTKVDKIYARIDTAETPGYFTLKSN